jgi:ADP-ribosylglycohydrolase
VAWEDDVTARGSADLLGPSSRQAIASIRAGGSVDDAGRSGATNGAAMRVTPIGIATPPGRTPPVWAGLVDRVVEISRVTHNTGIALAGASAVAAAVSAGIDGAGPEAMLSAAIEAARRAAGRGHWVAGADVAARIEWAVGLVSGGAPGEATDRIVGLVGTSLATQESVPAAFAVLAAFPDDPWTAVRTAASLGGDTDTIAAMVGAVAGARFGKAVWPAAAVAVIGRQDGDLGLDVLAAGLLAVRDGFSS